MYRFEVTCQARSISSMIFEIVSGALMLLSAFYGQPAITSASAPLPTPTPALESTVPRTTEAAVRTYFSKAPILVEIARCESTFRHTNEKGAVVRGLSNEYDVGVMQINELYHGETALELGHDIYTLEGNMAYAKWLYDREGLRPWKSSAKCWRATYPTSYYQA